MKNELKCSEAIITGLNIYQGINELKEFKGMEETGWSTVTKQLISRPDKVDGTSSNKTSPIIITAILLKRLNAASITIRYYDSCDYGISAENMKWPVIKELSTVMKSLHERKERSQDLKLTKLRRNEEFPMWLEKNLIQVDSFIENRGSPLSYLLRDDVIPPAEPDLLLGKP